MLSQIILSISHLTTPSFCFLGSPVCLFVLCFYPQSCFLINFFWCMFLHIGWRKIHPIILQYAVTWFHTKCSFVFSVFQACSNANSQSWFWGQLCICLHSFTSSRGTWSMQSTNWACFVFRMLSTQSSMNLSIDHHKFFFMMKQSWVAH